ncbi:MAG TPA: peptidoglycan DD-metalloendopeptidase family protein [Steroidobacteraceae bacterium]
MRLAQAVACLCVAVATLDAAHQAITPAVRLGQPLFPTLSRPVSQASLPGMDNLEALAAPDLAVIDVIVQRNDTLDHIFRRLQISLSDLADIRALAGVRAMLDRLNPGEHLKFLQRDGVLLGLERHVSLTQQLEVRRTGQGFEATVLATPVQATTALAHAVISSSLFESANAAGLSDAAVLELGRIFGSDIDFVLGLRAGDELTVEYQRLSQDGRYVKDGDILAARFVNQGRPYVAVRYVSPDGSVGYYSPEGRSMQQAFLRAPLEFRRISSRFSLARLHPILNTIRAHRGTDYAAPMGTPVYAAGAGRLVFRGVKGGYGNEIEIDHGNGIVTVYGHLSRFAAPRAGAHVEQGETIGYVGMTGLATGPHLHFEFHVNGRFVDPQRVKLPDARPIDAALRTDFERRSAPLLAVLNGSATSKSRP